MNDSTKQGGQLDRRHKIYLWMKENMPKALDMMAEGKRNGLTWDEPRIFIMGE